MGTRAPAAQVELFMHVGQPVGRRGRKGAGPHQGGRDAHTHGAVLAFHPYELGVQLAPFHVFRKHFRNLGLGGDGIAATTWTRHILAARAAVSLPVKIFVRATMPAVLSVSVRRKTLFEMDKPLPRKRFTHISTKASEVNGLGVPSGMDGGGGKLEGKKK